MTYKNYEFTAFSEAELDVGNVTCGTSFTMPSASVCISVSDNDAFLSGDSKKNEKATDKHGQHASITGDSGGDLGNGGKIYAEQYFWVCDNQGNWFVMVEIEQEGGGGDYFTFYNGGPWHAGTPEPGAELTVHSKCNVTNDYLLDYKCLGAGEKNEAPKAEADCIFVCEDEGGNDIDGNVLANDTDADGDALRVSGVDGRASNVGKWVDLDKGRVKISADGTIDFDADGDFDDLKLGETAEVVVKYDVSDGNGGNDWSMVTIKIEGKEPPIVTEPCTVQLLNHPDGAAAGPFYGLRLDNVFGEGIWTFDFEADGALMYATIDGSTIHIWGTAVGGRDTGSSYDDPALFAIDFTYDMVQQASGDDDLVVNAADQGQGAGTISRLDDDGSVVETKTLTDKAGSHPFSFRFGNEDDDDGHRGFEGKSGWGWLHVDGEDPAGAQDWLFTAGPKVMEPICVEENTSFVVDLDLEIDCPIKDIGVDLCAVKSKEGKPAELTLVYVRGDQIVQSTPDTKGKHDLDVLGADADGTVYIKVLSKKGATLFEGEVSEGESFSFDNGGKKLDSETTIKIYDRDGGDLLQKIDLHTSCSAPLAIGDIFGGVQLVGATTEKGTVFGTTGETLSEPNLVYSIAGGPDQDLFQVDPTTGAVSFTSPPDYENPQDVGRDNTYDVIVRATATVPGEEICIDFDDKKKGDKGSIIIDGVTFTAIRSQDNDGKFNDAMIFDANKPTGGDYDLKQPAQKKILIISEDGDKRDPDDNAKGGTIKAEFESPVTMTSIVLLDTEESGGSIEMFGVDGNLLATVAIPSIGNGDLQTIDLGDTEGVSVMQIHLEGSGAIDDVKFTRGGEEKYVEKAVRVEVKDVDEFGTITGRIFCDDDCDGLQNIECTIVETPIFIEDVWFAEAPPKPVKLDINKAVKSFSKYQGNGTWKSYDTTSDDENGQGDNLYTFGGTVVRFTLTVTNTSDQIATGVVVRDTIPENIDIWQPGESTVNSDTGNRWDNTRWSNNFDPANLELSDSSNGTVTVTEPGLSTSNSAIAAGATYGLPEGEVVWEIGQAIAPGETVELVYYGIRSATYDFGHGTEFTTQAEIIAADQPLHTGSNLEDTENVRWISPIAFDLNGNGKIDVTGDSTVKGHAFKEGAATVDFDLNNDGIAETIEWMQAGIDGLLLDLDYARATGIVAIADDFVNGISTEIIETDGGALFGDEGGTYENGFEKLALRDLDNSGRVAGAELEGLVIWVDDGDGVVEISNDPGRNEIMTLAEAGVHEISTEMDTDFQGRMLGSAFHIEETCDYTDRCPDAVGVTVNLIDPQGNVVDTVESDADGNYTFASVPPGDYTVQFVAPDGKIFTFQDVDANVSDDLDSDVDENGEVVISVGDNEIIDVDAGLKPVKGSISGRYFCDIDRNDVESAPDVGADSVLIVLQLLDSAGDWIDVDQIFLPEVSTGEYIFTGLAAGEYRVAFEKPADKRFVQAGQGSEDIDSDVIDVDNGFGVTETIDLRQGGDVFDVDAGIVEPLPGSISGRYFCDIDRNGFESALDRGVVNATIELQMQTPTGSWMRVALVTLEEDDNGNYSFANVAPGTYRVAFQSQEGKAFIPPGGDTATDSDVIDIDGGFGVTAPIVVGEDQNLIDVDAGIIGPEPNNPPVANSDLILLPINPVLRDGDPELPVVFSSADFGVNALLDNDFDPDGDTIQIISAGSDDDLSDNIDGWFDWQDASDGGQIRLNESGIFEFRDQNGDFNNPPFGVEIDTTIDYAIADEGGLTDSSTITVGLFFEAPD